MGAIERLEPACVAQAPRTSGNLSDSFSTSTPPSPRFSCLRRGFVLLIACRELDLPKTGRPRYDCWVKDCRSRSLRGA